MRETPKGCDTCAVETATGRYCALGRCYCGHSDCPAFDSYIDLSTIPLAATPKTSRRNRTSWDDRKESTWIDKL